MLHVISGHMQLNAVQGGAKQASTTPSGKPAFLAQPRTPAKRKQAAPGKALLGSGASLGKAESQQAGKETATGLTALIEGASPDTSFFL